MTKADFFVSYLTNQVDDTILKSILDNDADSEIDFLLHDKEDYWKKDQIKSAYAVENGKYNKDKFDADYEGIAKRLTSYEVDKGIKKLSGGGTIGEPGSSAGSGGAVNFVENNPVYMYNIKAGDGSPYTTVGMAGMGEAGEIDLRRTKTPEELQQLFTHVLTNDAKWRERTSLENLGVNNLKYINLYGTGVSVPMEFGKGEDSSMSEWRGRMNPNSDDYINLTNTKVIRRDSKGLPEVVFTPNKEGEFDKYGQTQGLLGFMGIQHATDGREGFIGNAWGFTKDAIKFGALNTLFDGGRSVTEIMQGLNAFMGSDRAGEVINMMNNAMTSMHFKAPVDVEQAPVTSLKGFGFQTASTIGQIGSAVLLSRLGMPPRLTMTALTLAGANGIQDAAEQMGLDKKTSALVMLGAAGLLFKTNQPMEYIWKNFTPNQKAETLRLTEKMIVKSMTTSANKVYQNPIKFGTGFGAKFVEAMKVVASSNTFEGMTKESGQEFLEQTVDLGSTALSRYLGDIGDYFGINLWDSYVTGKPLESGIDTYNKRFTKENLLRELGTSTFFGGLGGGFGGTFADIMKTKEANTIQSLMGFLNRDGNEKFMENARIYMTTLKDMKDNGELFSNRVTLNNTGEALAKLYPTIEGKPNTGNVNDLLYKKMTEELRQVVEIYTRTGINNLENKYDYTKTGIFNSYKVGKLENILKSDAINERTLSIRDGVTNGKTANAYVSTILDNLLDSLAYLEREKTKINALGTKDVTVTNRKKNPRDVTEGDIQDYKNAVLKGGETDIKSVATARSAKLRKVKIGDLVTAANASKQKINAEDSIEGKIAEVLRQITDIQQGGMADRVIKDVLVSSAYDESGRLLLDYFNVDKSATTPLQAFYNVDNSTRQYYNEYVEEKKKELAAYQQKLVENATAIQEIERKRGEALAKAQPGVEPKPEDFPSDGFEFGLMMDDYIGKVKESKVIIDAINLEADKALVDLVGVMPEPLENLDEPALIKKLYTNRIGFLPYKGTFNAVSRLDAIKREIELEAQKLMAEGEEYTNATKIRQLINEVKMRLAQAKINKDVMQQANQVVSDSLDFLPVEDDNVEYYRNWAKKQNKSEVISRNPDKTVKTETLLQQINTDLDPSFVTQISPTLAAEIERELNAYLTGMNFTIDGKDFFTGLNDLLEKAENGAKAAESNMIREDMIHIFNKVEMLEEIRELINKVDGVPDDLFNTQMRNLMEEVGKYVESTGKNKGEKYQKLYATGKEELKKQVASLQDAIVLMENTLQEKILKAKGLEQGNKWIADNFGLEPKGSITKFMEDSNDGKDVGGVKLKPNQRSNTHFVLLTTLLNYSNGDFYREIEPFVDVNVPSYIQQDIIKQVVCYLRGENCLLYNQFDENQLINALYLTGRAGAGKTSTVVHIALGIHYSSLNNLVINPYKINEDIFNGLTDLDKIKALVFKYGNTNIIQDSKDKTKTYVKYRIPETDDEHTRNIIDRVHKEYGGKGSKSRLKPGSYFIVVPDGKGNLYYQVGDTKGAFSYYTTLTTTGTKTTQSILALTKYETQNKELVDSIGDRIAKREVSTIARKPGEEGVPYLLRLLDSQPTNLDDLDVIVFDEATLIPRDKYDVNAKGEKILVEPGLETIHKKLAEYNKDRAGRGVMLQGNSKYLNILYAGDSLQDGIDGAIKPKRIRSDDNLKVTKEYELFMPTTTYMAYNFRSGTKSGQQILDFYRNEDNTKIEAGATTSKTITTEYALDDPIGVMAVNPRNTKQIDEVINRIPKDKLHQAAWIYNREMKDELVVALQAKYPAIRIVSDEKAQGLKYRYVIAQLELTAEQSKTNKAATTQLVASINEHNLNAKAASVVGRHTDFVLLLTSDKQITSIDKKTRKEVERFKEINTKSQRPEFKKNIKKYAKEKVEDKTTPPPMAAGTPPSATSSVADQISTNLGLTGVSLNVGKLPSGNWTLGTNGNVLEFADENELVTNGNENPIYMEMKGKQGRFHQVLFHFNYQGNPYFYSTKGYVIPYDEKSYTVIDTQLPGNVLPPIGVEFTMGVPGEVDNNVPIKEISPGLYVAMDSGNVEVALSSDTFVDLKNLQCNL